MFALVAVRVRSVDGRRSQGANPLALLTELFRCASIALRAHVDLLAAEVPKEPCDPSCRYIYVGSQMSWRIARGRSNSTARTESDKR